MAAALLCSKGSHIKIMSTALWYYKSVGYSFPVDKMSGDLMLLYSLKQVMALYLYHISCKEPQILITIFTFQQDSCFTFQWWSCFTFQQFSCFIFQQCSCFPSSNGKLNMMEC